MAQTLRVVDGAKLDAFLGRAVSDMAACMAGVTLILGHKLGLYRAMAGAGPLSSEMLAHKTGIRERYVREWLAAQAAGGYVTYDAASKTYELPPEQAFVLADAGSPAFFPPAYEIVSSMWHDEERLVDVFRNGRGFPWGEHHHRLFHGTEAFFKTGYKANLVASWLPALEGVEAKLRAGARCADVGCGHGASTILMAQAFPKSTFVGYDAHPPSIETARSRAKEAEVHDRVTFETAKAQTYPGSKFDLICFFDCLHDMGDPVGAARHALKSLKPDGTVLLVEPFAADRVEENLHPVGRLYYSASVALCVPNSLSEECGAGLGAQAGEARLGSILKEAGFTRFRRAATTPFNLVLEARP
ncbi:MAG TPA: class I SAM-dependent methyltransferase [Planctomycetota bacterium]|nr:class I SAM-dependent methyltransferase [Planctomycetota bacterium]